MKRLFTIAFLTLNSLPLLAEPAQSECVYNGQSIKPLDSIWVEDPNLVSQSTEFYKQKGYTREEISALLKNNDWTGFRLVCMPVVSKTPAGEQGSVAVDFEITGYSLTLTDVSLDFFESIKKHRKG